MRCLIRSAGAIAASRAGSPVTAISAAVFPHLDIRDNALQTAILREVVNAMNTIQRRLAGGNVVGGAFPNVFHVDLRHTLGAHDWADEMHPTNGGYAKVADRFRHRAALGRGDLRSTAALGDGIGPSGLAVDRGPRLYSCKGWPSAIAFGGFGLDKGIAAGTCWPPRD